MLRQFCLGNNLSTHIKENTDFLQQLLNAEANFEGCCYAGTALWFKHFNVFLYFKHDIGLFTKINVPFVSYLLCFYGHYGHFQLTFFCWDCLVKEYELSDNWVSWFMLQFVRYPLIIYITLLMLVYFVCLYNINFFCNCYITDVIVFCNCFL